MPESLKNLEPDGVSKVSAGANKTSGSAARKGSAGELPCRVLQGTGSTALLTDVLLGKFCGGCWEATGLDLLCDCRVTYRRSPC